MGENSTRENTLSQTQRSESGQNAVALDCFVSIASSQKRFYKDDA